MVENIGCGKTIRDAGRHAYQNLRALKDFIVRLIGTTVNCAMPSDSIHFSRNCY